MVRICFILIVLMTAASPSFSAEEPSLVSKGRALAAQHCASCHAIGPTGESLHKDAPPFRVVAAKWPLQNLEEALAEGIVTGHPDMPAFEMQPSYIEALIEYLATLLTAKLGTGATGGK